MQGKRLVLTIALYIVWSQIADFGMSRDLQDESYYISQSKKIPIKWTAPEVITNYYDNYNIELCMYRHYIIRNIPVLVMCGVMEL